MDFTKGNFLFWYVEVQNIDTFDLYMYSLFSIFFSCFKKGYRFCLVKHLFWYVDICFLAIQVYIILLIAVYFCNNADDTRIYNTKDTCVTSQILKMDLIITSKPCWCKKQCKHFKDIIFLFFFVFIITLLNVPT